MTDLLVSEVNEALRQDKLAQAWQRLKRPLAIGCIVLVLGTALLSARDYYREKQGAKAMEQIAHGATLYEKGDYAGAEKIFDPLRASTRGTLNDIVRLWYARSLTQQKKAAEAVTVLTAIAEHLEGDDPLWRDLACLRLEGLSAGALPKSCETTKGAVLKTQRDTWRAARLYQQGKTDAARALLDEVARDKTATAAERAQAQALLSVFGAVETKP